MQTDTSQPAGRGGDARYFVEVSADSQEALLKLQGYDLDLIEQTARARDDGSFSVEALVTQRQIEMIAADGYTVGAQTEAAARARAATETVAFDEWLRGMVDGEEEG